MVETSVRKIELPGICKHELHGLFMGQCQCISTSTNLFGQQSELLCSATLSNATVTHHFVKGTYEITEVACNSKNSGSFCKTFATQILFQQMAPCGPTLEGSI
jgi:hypothetical protein